MFAARREGVARRVAALAPRPLPGEFSDHQLARLRSCCRLVRRNAAAIVGPISLPKHRRWAAGQPQ